MAKKAKKPKKQPPENWYALLFGEDDCACPEVDLSPEEITDGLLEWQAMLSHFIELSKIHPDNTSYKEEIAFIRRSIQAEKIRKRELLANVI